MRITMLIPVIGLALTAGTPAFAQSSTGHTGSGNSRSGSPSSGGGATKQ